jgi:hypothetical protein
MTTVTIESQDGYDISIPEDDAACGTNRCSRCKETKLAVSADLDGIQESRAKVSK